MNSKMKNQFLLVLFTISLSAMISCNTKQPTAVEEKEDKESPKDNIVYNDSIQNTFFGVSFGAERNEVIKKLQEHNLALDRYNSSDSFLRFRSSRGRVFTFGNLSWEMLDIALSNNRFYYIRFMNAHKDKTSALHSFENILSTISAKYSMNELVPRDSTVYSIYAGYSKRDPQHEVVVKAYRYESISRDIYNGVSLEYYDNDYVSSVSDEL